MTDRLRTQPSGVVDHAAAVVEISSVHKSFSPRRRGGQRTQALADVNLTLRRGEFLCLLGPSGCGKSTLLNIIAGFLTQDSGDVIVDSTPVRGPGHDRGVLFQTPMLFPWLTTWHNVLYGPRARHALTPAVREEATALLNTVGLADFHDAYPHELSGGMRHRAAFARVLINRPSVLLMDEPFGALDAITRATMQRFLLDLWERERPTIVFVTHDVEEATLLGDRVCVMSARPGQVTAIFDVDLPRPRDVDTTETMEFVTIKRRIPPGTERRTGRRTMNPTVAFAVENADVSQVSQTRRAARRRLARRIGMGFLGLIVVLILWEIAASIVDATAVLPTVQTTVAQFLKYLSQPYPSAGNTIVQDALISCTRILVGFLLGSAAGIGLGSLMAGVRIIRELLDPLIELIRPLPPLAFIPLFIVWLGIGETSKIVLILVGVIPTVTIATLGALDNVPHELLNASRALRLVPFPVERQRWEPCQRPAGRGGSTSSMPMATTPRASRSGG